MKAHAIFRLGRDAEVRYLASGEAVANLALATNVRKGKEEVSVWVDASLWGKRAESLAPYLLKGTQLMADLEGLHIETFESAKGSGSKLVARVVDITLVGGKKEESAPSRPAPRPAARPAPASSGFDDIDSEMPF